MTVELISYITGIAVDDFESTAVLWIPQGRGDGVEDIFASGL
jgi:hypothetical protein